MWSDRQRSGHHSANDGVESRAITPGRQNTDDAHEPILRSVEEHGLTADVPDLRPVLVDVVQLVDIDPPNPFACD